MDYNNANYDIHEIYRKLHHKTAGRVTRSRETFNMQFEDLKNDKAVLAGLKDGEQFITFSYFNHHQSSAYYGSASDDPDFQTEIPLEHCIIWTAIEYYKKRGLDFFETGCQQFGPQLYDHPGQKDINISFFKRGFGGKIVPLYRGIKYYSKELMQQELFENTEKLMQEYWEDK